MQQVQDARGVCDTSRALHICCLHWLSLLFLMMRTRPPALPQLPAFARAAFDDEDTAAVEAVAGRRRLLDRSGACSV